MWLELLQVQRQSLLGFLISLMKSADTYSIVICHLAAAKDLRHFDVYLMYR